MSPVWAPIWLCRTDYGKQPALGAVPALSWCCPIESAALLFSIHPVCVGMGACFKPSVLSVDLIFHALLIEANFDTEIIFGQSATFVVLLQ